MIGIRHAKLTKCQMLDWIKACIAEGGPMPSDDEIVDRFNLSSRESARVLLAALAEEGAVTVHWDTPGRPIDLGPRQRREGEASARLPNAARRPTRTKRGELTVEQGAEKVMAILARKTERSEKAVDVSPKVETLPPPPASDPEPVRLPTAPGRKLREEREPRRQLNVSLPPAIFDILARAAKRVDKATGAYARDYLIAAVEKPCIPVDVVAAAIRADRPVCEFALGLLALGLDEYRRTAIAQ